MVVIDESKPRITPGHRLRTLPPIDPDGVVRVCPERNHSAEEDPWGRLQWRLVLWLRKHAD